MDTLATVKVVIRPALTGRHVDFVGDDPVQVFEAAQAHWSLCDPALRGPAPTLRQTASQYVASTREWGAQ